MIEAVHSDLVIIGAGCAGLSLARELASEGYAGRVDLIEPRLDYTDDRSWCFWAPEEHRLSSLVSATWPAWSISRQNRGPLVHRVPGLLYQYVRGVDFYSHALAAIDGAPAIYLHRGETVSQVDEQPRRCTVVTSGHRRFTAPQVIDTRPPALGGGARALLYQCFAGVELRFPEDHGLGTGTAGLMVDIRHSDDGVMFDYLLPLDHRTLLAEVTCFHSGIVAPDRLERHLEELLVRRQWQRADMLRRERGVLPMGLDYPRRRAGAYTRAGIGGGALRCATGYGFQRIQSWARECAARLMNRETPAPHASAPLTRFMDRLFLRGIRTRPGLAPLLYESLFTRAPPAAVVDFLCDGANWRQRLAIVASLPPGPFLSALAAVPANRGAVARGDS